jgi:hypothetical protein
MPKAGCTSLLWLLADLAGIPAETFAQSALPEVSPALTVHDMSLWGEGFRLSDYADAERERILTDDGWFRFTLVRHPAPRLWSAWQSKLLLREPRFVVAYSTTWRRSCRSGTSVAWSASTRRSRPCASTSPST